ncbi:MAG: hypothetical protein ACRD0K_14725 [Egibacteraceae bacterium]
MRSISDGQAQRILTGRVWTGWPGRTTTGAACCVNDTHHGRTISLLWLRDAKQAEPHARQAIACYETQPPPLHSPANHAQAQITLATCLVGQDQPDEGIRLAARALEVDRARVEPNLQQSREFLAALSPGHRDQPATRAQLWNVRTDG